MRDFSQLSAGQKQKVLIARALAQEKDISVVMAIHDLNLASRFSERTAILKDEKIYASGEPRALLSEFNISRVYGR